MHITVRATLVGTGLLMAVVGFGVMAHDEHRHRTEAQQPQQLYLVEGNDLAAAQQATFEVGGERVRNLEIIHGVAARLTERQADLLRQKPRIRLFADRGVHTSAPSVLSLATPVAAVAGGVVAPILPKATPVLAPVLSPVTSPVVQGLSAGVATQDGTGVGAPTLLYQTNYPLLVGADKLQQRGITGRGVTVAILDSGLWRDPAQNFGTRLLASVDVTGGGSGPAAADPYGHGTHVTSIAVGGAENLSMNYLWIAPQANLVVVRAFDGMGRGRYTDIIAGLNWVVANQKKYNVFLRRSNLRGVRETGNGRTRRPYDRFDVQSELSGEH